MRQSSRCVAGAAEVDPRKDRMRSQPQLGDGRSDEHRVLVTVTASAGVEQLLGNSVDIDGNGSEVPSGTVGDDVEILEADRVRVREKDLVEQSENLLARPLSTSVQVEDGTTEPEPIRIAAEERMLRHGVEPQVWGVSPCCPR
ncbi:hypothetical protein GCM10009813_13380 [Brevibacterium marinum]